MKPRLASILSRKGRGVAILGAVTALLAALAVLCSALAVRFQDDVIDASRYNRTFDLSQARSEALRLQLAVAAQFVSGKPIDDGDVALRFAILKTRLSVLQGPGVYSHDVVGTHRGEVAALARAVNAIDPLIARAAEPETAAAILQILSPLNAQLARLASLSNALSGDVVARNQRDLDRVFSVICVIILGLVLCGLALIGLMARQSRQMEKAAKRDWLTGLPNRAALHEIAATLDRSQDHALIFLDLDNFKDVNDTHGHTGGDRVLTAISQRLLEVAGSDAFLARLGGDEFAVLIAGDHAEARARAFAERAAEALRKPLFLDGERINASMSIGIALRQHGEDFDLLHLLKDADVALYAAKGAGRAQHVILTPDLRKDADYRRQLQHDLPAALAQQEFHLVFQPIVDLSNGSTRGFEALLRWDHPELGAIPPTAFIPLAEESGDISAIGRWVIDEGCRIARDWPADVFLSLNVSAIQFADPGLSQCVSGALRRWGVAPARITLEITESVLVSNGAAQRILAELRDIGVRIALDDFGTGYASMSYLRQYSFEKIKIDRSFVADMAAGNNSFAIVSAICSLAGTLSAEVVAEGIETSDHLDLACASGCSLGQGYFFARPMREAEVRPFIAARLDTPSLPPRLRPDAPREAALPTKLARTAGFAV
ncbi:putative bifunctional diguanylate cyclase/phosphodiesterase [Jiella sp. M17.18]|uniref:putative bifunctional diguanylate cyclase/phosphodiesterase n=1 Tax=Jiella sp. M17.18 TaxID=3234247 RepID=UPI0034DF59EC